MEYWVTYRTADGAELLRGASPEAGAAGRQIMAVGEAVMTLPLAAWQTVPINLALVKAACSAGIDAEAEACRSRFITPGSGQAMTYLRKETEARAFLADGDASACPMLVAEAAATGSTAAALAAIVLAAADAWAVIGAAIEAARRKAKLDIEAAGNLAEIAAAAVVDWSAIGS